MATDKQSKALKLFSGVADGLPIRRSPKTLMELSKVGLTRIKRDHRDRIGFTLTPEGRKVLANLTNGETDEV